MAVREKELVKLKGYLDYSSLLRELLFAACEYGEESEQRVGRLG